MALARLVIFTCFCVVITSKVTSENASKSENLVDEYYTTILEQPVAGDYLQQDEKDAQAIVASDRNETVIAGILAYRDKQRRYAINKRIAILIDPVVTYYDYYRRRYYWTRYWISDSYIPQESGNSTIQFWDLCFGLLEDENIVLSGYLYNFLFGDDETWIIIGMVLTKDIHKMIETYDRLHNFSFKEQRNTQREPFKNMMRVWVRHNREGIEKEELNHDSVVNDAKVLKSEYDKGHWHKKKRDQLELILMKKSIKYARAVITEFEMLNGNKTIESIIDDCVNNHIKLNHDLADAYSSLARYIKNKHKYIAENFAKYCNGTDHWAAWIMSIAVVHPQEWPKVDEAFRKDNKGKALTDFILEKLTSDRIMAEMIAVIVDPKFKPTTFEATPIDNGNGKPTPAPADSESYADNG